MKYTKIGLMSAVLLLFAGCSFGKTTISHESILRSHVLLPEHQLVAHALGSVDGEAGSNSREAFIENYEKGFRVFEADFSLTKDEHVVVFHRFSESYIGLYKDIQQTARAEFKEKKFKDRFTLMTADELLELLREYRDAYLITDTKGNTGTILRKIFSAAIEEGEVDLMDRIIPQIYEPADLDVVKDLYPFKDIIFTLYRTGFNDDQVYDFVRDSEITAVTMWWDERYTEQFQKDLQEIGVGTMVHTVNDPVSAAWFVNKGAGVYTDSYYKEAEKHN